MTNLIAIIVVTLVTNTSEVVTKQEPITLTRDHGDSFVFMGDYKTLERTRTTKCEWVTNAVVQTPTPVQIEIGRALKWSTNVVLTLHEEWVESKPFETPKLELIFYGVGTNINVSAFLILNTNETNFTFGSRLH